MHTHEVQDDHWGREGRREEEHHHHEHNNKNYNNKNSITQTIKNYYYCHYKCLSISVVRREGEGHWRRGTPFLPRRLLQVCTSIDCCGYDISALLFKPSSSLPKGQKQNGVERWAERKEESLLRNTTLTKPVQGPCRRLFCHLVAVLYVVPDAQHGLCEFLHDVAAVANSVPRPRHLHPPVAYQEKTFHEQ